MSYHKIADIAIVISALFLYYKTFKLACKYFDYRVCII